MKNIRFKFASIYSGGGLGSFGAHKAGGQDIFAIDFNKTAEKVYRKNSPNAAFFNMNALDVTFQKMLELGLSDRDISNIDILLLSPPCTGISKRNIYRHPFLPVNMLFLDCIRLVTEFKPKIAIIEDVDALLDDLMKPLFSLFLSKCQALTDYNFEYRVLNANDFGVPQSRKRFVGMLVRKDVGMPIFPEASTKDYEALYLNRLFPDVVGFDAGGTRKKVKSKHTNEVVGKQAKWRHANQVCGTLTATAGEKFLDIKTGARKISRDERLIICGAQDMNFEGIKDRELDFVTGNGIMPPFMEAICNCLADRYFTEPAYHKRAALMQPVLKRSII
jgi:site-specific DNA-cytosine methylase